MDIRLSPIPAAGCGLFAHRDLRQGDVVGPYTGENFASLAAMRAARGGQDSVYSLQGTHGLLVDAACLRGILAYSNEPRGSGSVSNLRRQQCTVNANHQNLFGPPDAATGLCAVLSRSQCGRQNPFWQLGWRRIPGVYLRPPFLGRSFVWLATTQNVPAGAELFYSYRSGSAHHRTPHSTVPRSC